MVKEAEANKEADKKKREEVDAKNHADSLIASTEQSLKEHGSKISEADKKAIEKDMEDLKEAIKSDKTEDIKTKTQQLMTSSMKLGEAIYKAQQDTAGAEKTNAKSDDKKDVVDAEFEEVKDDNKKNG
jgi:molecular chaperone DnaK